MDLDAAIDSASSLLSWRLDAAVQTCPHAAPHRAVRCAFTYVVLREQVVFGTACAPKHVGWLCLLRSIEDAGGHCVHACIHSCYALRVNEAASSALCLRVGRKFHA